MKSRIALNQTVKYLKALERQYGRPALDVCMWKIDVCEKQAMEMFQLNAPEALLLQVRSQKKRWQYRLLQALNMSMGVDVDVEFEEARELAPSVPTFHLPPIRKDALGAGK
jgi:hypothetical protein